MKKLMAALLALSLMAALLSGMAFAEAGNAKKATVMIYICGADLESKNHQATQTMATINQSGVNIDAVNVVALLGGATVWSRGYDTSKLSLVQLGQRRPTLVSELDLTPMSDPQTLTQFLDMCKQDYPAEKYYLIIWDHGGGPNQGVCQDYLFNYDTLTLNEMEQALGDSAFGDGGLEIIAFNTCLTSSLEFSAKLAPFARYMVATEDSMYGIGYDWLSTLDTQDDPVATGALIVDETFALNKSVIDANHDDLINSVSLVDLSKVPALVQAMDDFFPLVTPEVNNAAFTAVSQRRKDSTTFGVSESGGDSNRDLVDLGDLVVNLREYAPDQADALLDALDQAVVYKCSVTDACHGLTVYHPYSNKAMLPTNMAVHNDLGVSDGYSAYIQQFAAMLTGTPLADWSGLTTEDGPAEKDNRTLFTLTLTPEQAENLADSRLYVLQKHDDDSYSFTFENVNTVLKDNDITSEFSGTALYAVSDEGPLSEPLSYEITDSGDYRIAATLVREGVADAEDFEARALINCTIDPQTKRLTPGSILLQDESGSYTSIYNMRLSDFTAIRLPIVRRAETFAEDGTMLPFRDWDIVSEAEWSAPIDDSWSFALLNDTLDTTQLFATFQVTDSQSNWYSSQCRVVKALISGADEVRVEYDDMGLLLINSFSLSPLEGNLVLTASLTNLTDSETIVALSDLTMNGIALSQTAEAYGSGENWGLLPQEEQYLTVTVPVADLPQVDEITDVTFTLTSVDMQTNEAIGEVPVTVSLKLPM